MSDPTQQAAAGRLILLIVAVTYPLSAALLAYLKYRGESVPWLWPAAWLVTGVVGLVATYRINADNGLMWWVALVALLPIMVVSLVVDLRGGSWFVAAIDVAGIVAIVYGLWLVAGAG